MRETISLSSTVERFYALVVNAYFHELLWSRSLLCIKDKDFKVETSSVKHGGYKMYHHVTTFLHSNEEL